MTQPAPRHSSAATPLLAGYVLLIIYASLYPFTGWRMTGDPWWVFLTQWPRYWLRFDIVINFLGYMPLGVLATIPLLGRSPSVRLRWALPVVAVLCSALSLSMETTQNYIPGRVPSIADWLLNSAGALAGILAAAFAQSRGWLRTWRAWRDHSMEPHTRAIFVHLFLWPFALLFPTSVPFGLGQFYERLEGALTDLLQGTPFLNLIPLRTFEFEPMLPIMQSVSVALGLLMPLWSLDLLLSRKSTRLITHGALLFTGFLVLGLSFALSYGPDYAWIWLTPSVAAGAGAAFALGLLTLAAPRRFLALCILLALTLQTLLLNQASTSGYDDVIMQQWEQGQFVRFYGLGQWLGWVWPYLLGCFVLVLLFRAPQSPHPASA